MSTGYLQAISWKDVKVEGGFWGSRVKTNREVVLDYQYEKMEETGRIDNFRRASGKKSGKFEGFFSITPMFISGLRQHPTLWGVIQTNI